MSNTLPFIVSVVSASSITKESKLREYKTKVVWVNNAPSTNVRALSSGDTPTLKKIYGYDPLEDKSPWVPSTVGGSSNSIDRYAINLSPSMGDDDGRITVGGSEHDSVAPTSNFTQSNVIRISDKQDVNYTNSGGDDEFSMESLGEVLETGSRSAREKEVRRMFQARFAPTKQLTYSREITVIKDVWVLQEDSLSTLKKKIQLATGIPTYRQHLWYEQSGVVVSPCFSLWDNGSLIDVNIWNLRSTGSDLNGIPVNTGAYAGRANLLIRNNEFSATLESLTQNCNSVNIAWYVADINDLITNREQLASSIRNDVYVRELIYFGFVAQYWPSIPAGVFQTFISNELLLHDEYPEMAISDSLLQRQLLTETSIIAANPEPSIKNVNIYLAESDIGVINEYYTYGGVVNLRTLFNMFKLSLETPHMIGRFSLGGRVHTVTKTFANGRLPSKKRYVPIDTICIMTILNEIAELFIYVHTSGVYHTEAIWRENVHVIIDDARVHTINGTNNIIGQINRLGESVVVQPLVLMTQDNISVIDTNIIMSITKRFNNEEFEGLKNNAQLFKRANMLNITSSEPSSFMFHFFKGMYNYDDARFDVISNTTNGYEYATSIVAQQRWEGIYMRQRLTSITNRSTDIYIRAHGIKFAEYSSFIKYILMLIEMPIVGKTKGSVTMDKSVKSISQLKELDPLLYDLKKIYGNKVMYSQICQKPNQPIIVDKPGPKSVKYWNFTKKEVAYYECPSEKHHALYFKTGVHPANFCIPCCKKVSVVPGSKHDSIFSTCMKDRVYIKNDRANHQSRSGYIISYTPDIEPGRISYLPEASLDQLFYQQFSTSGVGVDTECIPNLGYYVFGIDQHISTKQNVGVICAIAHAAGIPVHDFITDTARKIHENQTHWSLILSGKISNHFRDATSFTGELETTFNSPTSQDTAVLDNVYSFNKWNEAFIDIARLYWNINVMLFIDSGDDNFFIKTPRGIKRADELISSQHKHLFIICSDNQIYHPIYQVDTKLFKKTGAIVQTLFSQGDKIISVVKKMMTTLIANPGKGSSVGIDLDEVLQWIDSRAPKYNLHSVYINKSNTCYAIRIIRDSNEASLIYFPVSISLHDHLDIRRTGSDFSLDGYTVGFVEMKELLDDFNEWTKIKTSASEEQKTQTRAIIPTVWLILDGKIIGFQDSGRQYNYYCAPMTIDDAKSIMPLPMIRLRYDPTKVNALINTNPPPIEEPKLGQFMYEHHGYQLFVLEFISAIDKKKNVRVREKISAIIHKYVKSPEHMIRKLSDILSTWSRDYDHIIAILNRLTKSRECNSSPYSLLLSKMNDSVNINTIIAIIEQSRFEFDDEIMTSLFSMNVSEILSEIQKILINVIDVSADVDVSKFPDAISTCQNGPPDIDYCKDRKLRVSERDYKIWSSQLSIDIKNPIKQRKLIALMTRGMTNEFSFMYHPGETIYISLG